MSPIVAAAWSVAQEAKAARSVQHSHVSVSGDPPGHTLQVPPVGGQGVGPPAWWPPAGTADRGVQRAPPQAGVPITVVSERLGHATVSFTLDVYGWVLPGMQAEATALFRG
jgi:hypothetical protein